VHVPTSKYPQIRKPLRCNHWRHSAPISYLPISCRTFGGHQVLKPWSLGSRPLLGRAAPFLKGCARQTTYSTEQSRRGFRTFKIPQLWKFRRDLFPFRGRNGIASEMAPHTNGIIFQTGQPKQEREEVHNAQRQRPYQVPKLPGTGVAAPNFRKAHATTQGCPVATRPAWNEIWHAGGALKVARRQSCDFQLRPITAHWRENMEANRLLQSFSRNENLDQHIWLRNGNVRCKHSSLLVITWLPWSPGCLRGSTSYEQGSLKFDAGSR
jgi:hypothetical protein